MPGAIFFASLAALISGVLPSPSVITGVRSVTGRNLRYSSMSPRQRFMTSLVLALDTDQGRRLGHERHTVDFAERSLDVAFSCHVCLDDDGDGLSLPPPFLQHRRDADATAAQFSCDLRQNSGTIDHHESQVIEGANLFHGAHAKRTPFIRLERRRGHPTRSALQQIAGAGDD